MLCAPDSPADADLVTGDDIARVLRLLAHEFRFVIIDTKAKAVVTQPTAGEFKAFDSTCTHKGCPVSKVEGDTISCTCHGSQYSIEDGSVKRGPATRGLTPVKVVQEDGELFLQG